MFFSPACFNLNVNELNIIIEDKNITQSFFRVLGPGYYCINLYDSDVPADPSVLAEAVESYLKVRVAQSIGMVPGPSECIMLSLALLSVYDKTDLLELAKGLAGAGVRLPGSRGTAKKIREAPFKHVFQSSEYWQSPHLH